jgi:phosphoribosyl-AMP cyclohydrolase
VTELTKPHWLDEIRWNEDGLVTAIAQDVSSGKILMLAWMNRESLLLTATEAYVTYWSRSRQKLWRKGEESGNRQKVLDIRLDCDGDAILLIVEQIGGIACHTGRHNCFYRSLREDEWEIDEPVLKSPELLYKKAE